MSGKRILALAVAGAIVAGTSNADDDPKVVAAGLLDADAEQFAALFPKLRDGGGSGVPVLADEIDRTLPPGATDDARERLAKRKANAAVALLRLDRPEKVWPLVRHTSDPGARTHLIHRMAPLGVDPNILIKRLDKERDVTIRRALILALGEFGEEGLPPKARTALLPQLQEYYRTDADPGLHASVEWLLRTWKQEAWLKRTNDEWARDKEQRKKRLEGITRTLEKGKAKAPPQWYVNGQGQTLAVLAGPVEFVMGEGDGRHKRRIDRSYAIGATEVTVEQFRRFRENQPYDKNYSVTADCPVNSVSWYEAAAYCNWLSEQEGRPKDQWCYLPNAKGEYAAGMKAAEDYLRRSGYRLPTEAEWEYACRAGAGTRYSFGDGRELLGKYAWSAGNSRTDSQPAGLHPVGRLKPNDFGLFDMHGNAWEWTQDVYAKFPPGEAVTGDNPEGGRVADGDNRVVRGGSFLLHNVSSAMRWGKSPTTRLYLYAGFRVARTLP